jgi:mono/diheme cytochrome c family protein
MSTYRDERFPIPTPGRLWRELRLRRPPLWMVAVLFVVVSMTWVPLAFIARARVSFSDRPRVQFVQDMANQPRLGPQQASAIFADGRAMRLPPPGTMARTDQPTDPHYTQGMASTRDAQGREVTAFATSLPPSMTVDRRLLERGREMYGVSCAMCHGYAGYGDGAVNRRALELKEAGWVAAPSLHERTIAEKPDGYLFSAITNGVRTMPAHGPILRIEDRWAIVTYVRALQRSQRATLDDVPAAERTRLEAEREATK